MGPNQPLIFDAAVFLLLLLLLAAAGTIAYDGHVWGASGLIAGGLAGAGIFVRHEGQRLRTQAALTANQERLSVIIDASADGLLVLDASGFVRFANPAAMELLGRPRDKVVGSQLGFPVGDDHPVEVDIPRTGQPPGVALMRVRAVKWDGEAASLVLLQEVTDLKAREAEARREARIHAMLSACNHLLVRTTEIQPLREGFCRQIVEVGGYAFAWVGLLEDGSENAVRPVAWAGNGEGFLQEIGLASDGSGLGQGPVGTAVRTGQPELVEDTQTDPRFVPWREPARRYGYKAMIALPLHGEEAVFGVLAIYSTSPGVYDDKEVRLLQEMAGDLAFGCRGLELRQAHDEAEAARAEAERQYRLVLQSTGEGIIGVGCDGLITFANRAATELLGFTIEELECQAAHDLLHHSRPDGSEYPQAECPMQATLEDGRSRRVDDEVLWRADGTALPVDYTSNPVWQDDELLGCVISFSDISRRREAEAQRDRLGEIIEATPDLVSYATPDGEVEYLNPGGRRLLGVSPDGPLPQRTVFDRRPEWVIKTLREEGYPTVRRDGAWQGETAYLDKDGNEIPVSQLLVAHRDSGGKVNYISSIARDIRDRKQLESALRTAAVRQESFANSVISTLPGIYYLSESEEGFQRWNDELERVTSYAGEALAALRPVDLIARDSRPAFEQAMQQALDEGATEVEADLLTRDGQRRPYVFSSSRVDLDDTPMLSTVAVDISRRKEAERRLRRMATHDPLTGLLNRRGIDQRLNQKLKETRRYGRPLSVVLLDIDHFKDVNDTYGHDVGDEVLKEMAKAASVHLRESDMLARWGGEEFLVVAPETGHAGALELGEKLRETVEETPQPKVGRITVSAGVATYREEEKGVSLVKRADEALYRAKENGRNRVESGD